MDKVTFDRRLRDEVRRFVTRDRGESSAFLIWFLVNYFRLDEQNAIDSVCDSRNDRGIDGIYVDNEEETIYLFQSKYSPNLDSTQGDNDLRKFVGAKEWFRSSATIDTMLAGVVSPELKSVITRLHVREKIDTGYSIELHFVTNKLFEAGVARPYLNANREYLTGYDGNDIFDRYTYIADEEIRTDRVSLSLMNNSKIVYNHADDIVVRLYAIQVKELLKFQGIQDRTLFSKNVRFGLGKTRVNKEIEKTLRERTDHSSFFLFHNGITIICDELTEEEGSISFNNYSIINGCQSMITFYENRNILSDELYVPIKIIEIGSTSPMVHRITHYANNQNAISLQDLKSDDGVQKQLRREFDELGRGVLYRIKRGEAEAGFRSVIAVDFAAQLIESYVLNSPQSAHLKSELFGEKYADIFSRKITAYKLYLVYLIHKTILGNIHVVSNEQVQGYGLAVFCFLHIVGEVLRDDEVGNEIDRDPKTYLATEEQEAYLLSSISHLWQLLAQDINQYIENYATEHGGFFDYKNTFKNADFVRLMAARIKADHNRAIVRHAEDKFANIYHKYQAESRNGSQDRLL